MSTTDEVLLSWRTQKSLSKRERRLKLTAWAFAAAAVVAAAAAVFFAAADQVAAQDAVHWRNLAKSANLEILAADEVAAELRRRLADEKEMTASLKYRLDDQEMRYARRLERLAGIDEQLEAAHAGSVTSLLKHIEVHHAEIRILKHREGWLRRDLSAITCYVTKECDPTRVDFGGEVRR